MRAILREFEIATAQKRAEAITTDVRIQWAAERDAAEELEWMGSSSALAALGGLARTRAVDYDGASSCGSTCTPLCNHCWNERTAFARRVWCTLGWRHSNGS